ncbi:MAG: hypothetical protein IVW36_05530 [Dehalococcoidia bacterium]|nr:hypothetical protein [Dehalococcoidia bacterium]
MTTLLVASAEPRVGRSLVAAGLAYRLARDGAPVTLARLAGDDGAVADAAAFAALPYLSAPDRPLSAEEAASLSGDAVIEAPAGAVRDAASTLDARVVVVGGAKSPDVDLPAAALLGRIVTRVPAADLATVAARAGILAALPEDRILAVPSLDDIAGALDARWLHRTGEPVAFDRIMIGTVASDAASPYFANRERICVITRFDKTDIQLAALLTDLRCMVITGGGEPSPYLLDRVVGRREEVAVFATAGSTVETMAVIEPLYGQSRFDGEGKLERIVALLDDAGVVLPVPVA